MSAPALVSGGPVLRTFTNGWSIDHATIPVLDQDTFGQAIVDAVAQGQRVVALFGAPGPLPGTTALYAVLADDEENLLAAARTEVVGDRFTSLTPRCPQVHLFEREIAEQYGLLAEGHPWLKPVRYHHSWTGRDVWGREAGQPILPGVGDFYRLEGEEVHEVAVGPVHAGIIEPGHFRFQCQGEPVRHLEIALGYQHRGVEEAMLGGPHGRCVHYAETGRDTTIAHTNLLLPGAGVPEPLPRRAVPRPCAASLWNWSAWPTTWATWALWRATWAFCPRPATAAASAATS